MCFDLLGNKSEDRLAGAYPDLPESLDRSLARDWGEITFVGLAKPADPESVTTLSKTGKIWFDRALRDGFRPWIRWPFLFLRWMIARIQTVEPSGQTAVWPAIGSPFSDSINARSIYTFYRNHRGIFRRQLNRWQDPGFFINQLLLQSVTSPFLLNQARVVVAQLQSHAHWNRFLKSGLSQSQSGRLLAEITNDLAIQQPIFKALLDEEQGAPDVLVPIFRLLAQHPDESDEAIARRLVEPAVIWNFLEGMHAGLPPQGPSIQLRSNELRSGWWWRWTGGETSTRFALSPPSLTEQYFHIDLEDAEGERQHRYELALWPCVMSEDGGIVPEGDALEPGYHGFVFHDTNWDELDRRACSFEEESCNAAGLRWAVIEIVPSPSRRMVQIDDREYELPYSLLVAPKPARLLADFAPPILLENEWHSPGGVGRAEVRYKTPTGSWFSLPGSTDPPLGGLVQARLAADGQVPSAWAPDPPTLYLPGFQFFTPPWHSEHEDVIRIHAELPKGYFLGSNGKRLDPDSGSRLRYRVPIGEVPPQIQILDSNGSPCSSANLSVPIFRWSFTAESLEDQPATLWPSQFHLLTQEALQGGLILALSFGHQTSYWLEFTSPNTSFKVRGRCNAKGFDRLDGASLRNYCLNGECLPSISLVSDWGRIPLAGPPEAEKLPQQAEDVTPKKESQDAKLLAFMPERRPGTALEPGIYTFAPVVQGRGYIRAKLLVGTGSVLHSTMQSIQSDQEIEAQLVLTIPDPQPGDAAAEAQITLEWSLDGKDWHPLDGGIAYQYRLFDYDEWVTWLCENAQSPEASLQLRLKYLNQLRRERREATLRAWHQSVPLPDRQLTAILPVSGASWQSWMELPQDPRTIPIGIGMPASICRATLELLAGMPRRDFSNLNASLGAIPLDNWWILFRVVYSYLTMQEEGNHQLIDFDNWQDGSIKYETDSRPFMEAACQLAFFLKGMAHLDRQTLFGWQAASNCWDGLMISNSTIGPLPDVFYLALQILKQTGAFLMGSGPIPTKRENTEMKAVEGFLQEDLAKWLCPAARQEMLEFLRYCQELGMRTQPRKFIEAVATGHWAAFQGQMDEAKKYYCKALNLGTPLEKDWLTEFQKGRMES